MSTVKFAIENSRSKHVVPYPPIVYEVQPDQINMAVLFWYIEKSDARVRYCTEVMFYKVLKQQGHVKQVNL